MIVADASLMIAVMLDEPHLPQPTEIRSSLMTTPITVPAHWPAEIANALWANLRRGRMTRDQLTMLAEDVASFEPTIDAPPDMRTLSALIEFSADEKLTVSDAIYVRLALTQNATLATLDGPMRAAARRLNIPLLPA